MRFAVVGDAPSVLAVARAVAVHPAHDLVAAVCANSQLAFLGPTLRSDRTWEELVADPDIDAVILGPGAVDELVAARQAVAAGKLLLAAPECAAGSTFYYELSLQQAEQSAELVPLYLERGRTETERLAALVQSGRLGKVQHVQFERRLRPDASTGASGRLSVSDISRALIVDLDLVRFLFGDYDQVTAIRTGNPEEGISLSTVTLAGARVPQVVWTATADAAGSAWRLTVFGDLGRASVHSDVGAERPVLESSLPIPDAPVEERNVGKWLLDLLPNVSQPSTKSSAEAIGPRGPEWNDLARGVELLDAAERSVKRRRTIDVHFETPSERGQFKTQMTAVGCSLLMLTFVGVVLYLTLATAIELPGWLQKTLVVLIFAPLGVFLALQVLLFVTQPGNGERGRESERG